MFTVRFNSAIQYHYWKKWNFEGKRVKFGCCTLNHKWNRHCWYCPWELMKDFAVTCCISGSPKNIAFILIWCNTGTVNKVLITKLVTLLTAEQWKATNLTEKYLCNKNQCSALRNGGDYTCSTSLAFAYRAAYITGLCTHFSWTVRQCIAKSLTFVWLWHHFPLLPAFPKVTQECIEEATKVCLRKFQRVKEGWL